MEYYIYPNGNCGKSVGWILEFLGNVEKKEVKITYCDDEKIKNIPNDTPILVASYRYGESLISNLLKKGLTNYKDGIREAGLALNRFLKSRFNPYKTVAFLLDDYRSQKHFGKIEEELLGFGFCVIKFILPDILEYERLQKEFVVCQDMLCYLDSIPFVVGTGEHFCFAPNVKYMRILSSYYIPNYHAYYHSSTQLDVAKCASMLSSRWGGGAVSA